MLWVSRILIQAALLVAVALASGAGFSPLFDGKSLAGWTLVAKRGSGYSVEDGMLVSATDETGILFTQKEYSNFILRFEFRLSEAANNGIGIRAPLEGGKPSQTAMEIQILDDDSYRGKLTFAQNHGSIYGVVPAREGSLKRAPEWNDEEIQANGNRIIVTLNGTVIIDADLSHVRDPEILRQHPGLFRHTGHIGLIAHRSRVDFRNISIKELP